MQKVYIVSARRTPVGSFLGMLKNMTAVDLAVTAIKASLTGSLEGLKDKVDEVNLGCILQAGSGQGIARQAAIGAALPQHVPAVTTNILCGSGLFTVAQAARAIRSSDAHFVIAGGTESMSQSPYLISRCREGLKMGHTDLKDSMVLDALTDAFHGYHMGNTAENLALKYDISRQNQDEFALQSQKKASQAQKEGRFVEEIAPCTIQDRKGEIVLSQDEYIRHDCTLESLAKLKPAFKKDGSVTAGNASGINDGAAVLAIVSEQFLKEHGLQPLAEIVTSATCGVDPAYMGIGPVPAVQMALKKASWSLNEVDLIEANEAFAAQALAVGKELNWNPEKVNVNGGAIALGHPVGASGARILITLLYELRRRKLKKGLATLCVGGGMGVALAVQIP